MLLTVALDTDPNTMGNQTVNYGRFYDGNGNVMKLLDRADGSTDAHHEYHAYGAVVVASGAYADENLIRFSTKWHDPVTGLGDCGRCWRGERWLSRDPIGDAADVSLYRVARNDAVNGTDAAGLQSQGRNPPSGTCKDCKEVCQRRPDDIPYGRTTCENGNPCHCVCTYTIRTTSPIGSYPGLDIANHIIEDCVERHEKIHVIAATCCGENGNKICPDEEGGYLKTAESNKRVQVICRKPLNRQLDFFQRMQSRRWF